MDQFGCYRGMYYFHYQYEIKTLRNLLHRVQLSCCLPLLDTSLCLGVVLYQVKHGMCH